MPVCCCSGCLDAQTLTGAGRWLQHMQLFGGSAGFLSDTFYAVLEHVDDNFCDACLSDPLRFRPWFDEWAAAVASAAGVAIRGGCRIIGFVDGTIRPICRPTRNQEWVYSGHKRVRRLRHLSRHLCRLRHRSRHLCVLVLHAGLTLYGRGGWFPAART